MSYRSTYSICLVAALFIAFSAPLQAQTTLTAGDTTYRGNFSTDAKTGAVNGTGTVLWKNGNRYEGTVVNTQLTGKGSFTWANGDTYVGDMVNAQPHGQGTYTFKSGDRYTGAWRNGQKHGQGRYTFANGTMWEGEFANDQQFKEGAVAVVTTAEAAKTAPAPVPVQATTVALASTAATTPASSSVNSVAASQAVRSRPPAFHNYCELRIDKTIYLGSCKDGKMHGRGLFVDVVKDRGIWDPVVYLRPVRHDMGVAYGGPRSRFEKLDLQKEGVGALVDRANYLGMHAILDRPDLLDRIDPAKWSDFGSMQQVKATREFQKMYANDDYDNLLPDLLKRMDELQLETYRSDWNLVTRKDEVAMFEEFRRRYSAYDPDNRVASIPEHLRRLAYKRYRDDFDQAQGVESLEAFIHNYSNKDPDKLIPQARQRLALAVKKREDMHREKAQAAADRAKRLCASLYVGKAVNLVGDVFGVSILSYRGVVTGFSVKQNSVSVRINDRSDMHDQMVEIGCERLRD